MYYPFEAKSKVFGELLGDTERSHFVVPKFQRGFSWEKKHVQPFWDDIRRFQKERLKQGGPSKYFLGLIVTMPDKDKPTDITYILDGQQRLATATILLACIRDAARSLGTKESVSFADDIHNHSILKPDGKTYALTLGVTDKLFFSETVQAISPQKKEVKNLSQRNVKSAKRLLSEQLDDALKGSKAKKLEALRELATIIKSDLIMACVPVSELREAFRIFETLNDRGLRLSVPDLLLNYLMGEAQEDQHEEIRDFWTEMVDEIGKYSLNNFLRHMWVSEHGDEKRDLFTVIKDEIENNQLTSLYYARRASAQCTRYMELVRGSNKLGEAAVHVSTILNDLDTDKALPLLLSAYTHLNPADVRDVAKWLVIFIVRFAVISDLNPGVMEGILFSLAKDVHAFATKKKPPASSKIAAHVKKVLKDKSPNDQRIVGAISEVTLKETEARYIIKKLAGLAESTTGETGPVNATVEHIFPKKANVTEWPNIEELKPLLWHIGNLTMIRPSLGNAIGNAAYDKKRPSYQSHSELKMTQAVGNSYVQWTPDIIKKRAESMAADVNQIWNFDNASLV